MTETCLTPTKSIRPPKIFLTKSLCQSALTNITSIPIVTSEPSIIATPNSVSHITLKIKQLEVRSTLDTTPSQQSSRSIVNPMSSPQIKLRIRSSETVTSASEPHSSVPMASIGRLVRNRIGSHVCFLGTLGKTYQNILTRNLPSIQFFLGSSKGYKRTIISEDDIQIAQALQNEHHINTYAHLPYIYNLAGSKKHNSLAWRGNAVVDTMMTGIVKSIEYELGVMGRLKTAKSQTGCVIHVGTWANKQQGIQTIAETLNRIHFPSQSGSLLLENTAGSGTTIGKTFEELAHIYRLLDPKVQEHVKICIDTQHIFASGQYNLQTEDEVDRLFREFQGLFPIDRLGLVHFNDSSSVFNSQVDNHAFMGRGEIWGKHHSSMNYMLGRLEHLRIPMLVE
jgi:deoxyribonuclease-4